METILQKKGNEKQIKRYKSLYEVKEDYLPNKKMDFLERSDETITQNGFLDAIIKQENNKKKP